MPVGSPNAGRTTSVHARCALAIWLIALSSGMALMTHSSLTAGAVGASPERWPVASIIPRPETNARIVVSVHPACPCTSATMAELSEWVQSQQNPPEVVVLAVLPDGEATRWDLRRLAEQTGTIPGARLIVDPTGVESLRHGAMTSGHLAYYDAAGVLRFRGGVTASRGHRGPSAGLSALSALTDNQPSESPSAPVFGCPLHDPECSVGSVEPPR